ncbi:MAG: helix-turn-helix domain-containing protein [Hyphomicrobiaceae bacterium]
MLKTNPATAGGYAVTMHLIGSPYLTLNEAAAFLRLAPRTLDNMRQRGTGPLYNKHGGRVRYHRDDLIDWADQSRRRTTTEKVPLAEARSGPKIVAD